MILTDSEFEAMLERPRRCARCGNTYPTGDFPTSTARGKVVFRSYCAPCLASYYREVAQRRKWKTVIPESHTEYR